MTSNRSTSYNVNETAALVFASEDESEPKISDSDLDLPLSDGGNETVTSHESSDEEGGNNQA